MTIPSAFRPESARNADAIPPDSALSQPASQNSQPSTTSSRTDALARGRASESAATPAIRTIHPLDALTAALCSIRPDWSPERTRAVLARDRRSWRDVTIAALRAALDTDVRSPAAIENHDHRDQSATPGPMSWEELRKRERCPNGAIHDPHPCALCRAGVGA